MNKHITPTVAIVAALFAGAAMPAAAQESSTEQVGGTYLWIHPKLGIVKVNRATGALVQSQGAAKPSAQAEGRTVQTTYWLDPKGKHRVIKTPVTVMTQDATVAARN